VNLRNGFSTKPENEFLKLLEPVLINSVPGIQGQGILNSKNLIFKDYFRLYRTNRKSNILKSHSCHSFIYTIQNNSPESTLFQNFLSINAFLTDHFFSFQYLSKVNHRADKKDYIVMQEVERTWTPNIVNTKNSDNSLAIERKDSLNSIVRSNKSNYSLASMASYKQQRTKSLCVFYQTNIVNTVKATINSPRNLASTADRAKHPPVRDTRYLQNHEKILEAQNKWTGNGKFIVKEKTLFMVS